MKSRIARSLTWTGPRIRCSWYSSIGTGTTSIPGQLMPLLLMIVEDGKVNENLKFFLLALVGVVMIIWLAYAITVIISVVIG